jgi:hypothetical protein
LVALVKLSVSEAVAFVDLQFLLLSSRLNLKLFRMKKEADEIN